MEIILNYTGLSPIIKNLYLFYLPHINLSFDDRLIEVVCLNLEGFNDISTSILSI